MNFRNLTSTEAISECGMYTRKKSQHPGRREPYFNCWHIPTGAHVAAGFTAAEISRQVDEHKARQGK